MMKKRFLLALIAVSMSLAGCGKNKDKEEDNTQTVDPTDEGGEGGGQGGGETDPGEGGEEGGGGGEEEVVDTLTPEQRANASSFEATINAALSAFYSDEEAEAVSKYALAYSEEIALEGATDVFLDAHAADLLVLFTNPTAEAVINFLGSLKEDESLDDFTYFVTATGKTFLRAQAEKDSEKGEIYEYVADYLDKEETDLHENLFGLVDSLIGAVTTFTDEKFTTAVEGIFDKETNQFDLSNLSTTISSVSKALGCVMESHDNVTYLANLVFNGLVNFAEEYELLSEETLAKIKEFNVSDIVDKIYGGIAALYLGAFYLNSEESPVTTIVTLVNLALAKEYLQLLLNLVFEYSIIIDATSECASLIMGVIIGIANTKMLIENLSEELNKEFSDFLDENDQFSAEILEEVVTNCGSALQNYAAIVQLLISANEGLMGIVSKTLVKFFDYSEEAAEEFASKLDITSELDDVFGFIGEVGTFLVEVDPSVYEIIAHVVNEEYLEAVVVALNKAFELIGSEVRCEDILMEVVSIVIQGVLIVNEFKSEEFKEKYEAVVDPETGEADATKMKELVSYVGTTLKDILNVADNAYNIAVMINDIVKCALVKSGMSSEDADKVVEKYDLTALANKLGPILEKAIDYIIEAGESDRYELIYEAIEEIYNTATNESSTPVAVVVEVIMQVISITFAELDITSQSELAFELGLASPYLAYKIVETYLSSEGFAELFAAIVEIDEESGEQSINSEAILALLDDVNSNVIFSLIYCVTNFGAVIDVIEEIAMKESEYDVTSEDSIFNKCRALLDEVVKYLEDASSYLTNEDDVLDFYLSFVEQYGILALRGFQLLVDYLEDGVVNQQVLLVFLLDVASEFLEVEKVEFTYDLENIGETDERVINLLDVKIEGVDYSSEGGACSSYSMPYEKDGDFYIDFIFVDSYSYEVIDSTLVEFTAEGEIYTVKLPSYDLLASLFSEEASAEVVEG